MSNQQNEDPSAKNQSSNIKCGTKANTADVKIKSEYRTPKKRKEENGTPDGYHHVKAVRLSMLFLF